MSGVLKSGARFAGRYYVEAMIAEGGMASIYRAMDEQVGRYVAVKVLYPYYGDNEIIRERFVDEGRIQQELAHPNIVLVQEIVMEPLAIIMEHVAGPTLDDYLAEKGQLEESEMLDIIIPVMSALGLAHSKGIIHRDLKPSNILLNQLRDGFQPKVMDFGVAKVKDAKRNLTATGTTVGTLHYMSPEQIVGSKNIDGRADIYSLGVTLYKLATGEVPFNAPTEFALMMAQVEAPPLPPSKLRPGLSQAFEDLILKAMEKKPKDRFQTVREFTTALLSIQESQNRTSRDTITESISIELLEFAMAADEVAKDRTGEMSLAAIRDSLSGFDLEGSMEPTVEIETTLKIESVKGTPAWADPDESYNESTVELTAADIVRLSTIDGDKTADDERPLAATAETDIMDRKPNLGGPSGPTWRTSGPQGMGSLVSESVETNSIKRRLSLESDRVVVLDADADSRDMTAPKMRQEEFKRPLPRPSGPKVVLGYNPADTQDKTFEKPNYRTSLPQFETSKSSEDFDKQVRQLRQRDRPHTRPEGPARPRPNLPRPSNSGLMQRIDFAAQGAIEATTGKRPSTTVVVIGAIAVSVIIISVITMIVIGLLG